MADDESPGFTQKELPKAGLIGRLTGRVPPDHAFIEIRNHLASTPFDQVRPSEVEAALAKARLTPREAVTELQGIFEHAAFTLAADGELGPSDQRALAFLQRAFDLSDTEASEAVRRSLSAAYLHRMREALADGEFTPEERQSLDSTATSLGLTKDEAATLYQDAAIKAVQAAFNVATADRRFEADEERQVQELAASLGVTIEHSEKTLTLLERFRLLGRIANGEMPAVSVPILLQKGESCHFAASNLAHREMRTVTTGVKYSGVSSSVRLIGNVRWRSGSYSTQRVTQDVLAPIDTVDFYITSKKLFLRGQRKNTSVPLSKVVHFTIYNDGIQIEKQTGKDLYLVGGGDWELAGACLDSAARITGAG